MHEVKVGSVYYPQPFPKARIHTEQKSATSFDSLLQNKIEEQQPLQFSNHARQRLEKRGIELSQKDISRLTDAVQKAKAKGANESLVLMDRIAYIVNVPNRKVITAVDPATMQDNVFTNIDSAVIV